MLSCKFKFLVPVLFLLTSQTFANFLGSECLNASYKSTVSHKGQPFGMTKNILSLEKNGCVVIVKKEKLKFMKQKWIIDVCRSPIHIKEGDGAIEVYKRNKIVCREGDTKIDFCKSYHELLSILQDDGLIFAQGEKEDLQSDHGKVYCSYLLIKGYLQQGKVFSRYAPNTNIPDLEKSPDEKGSY